MSRRVNREQGEHSSAVPHVALHSGDEAHGAHESHLRPQVERPPGPLSRLWVPTSLLDLTLRGLRGYSPAEGLSYWFGRETHSGIAVAMVAAFPRIYSSERSFQLAEGQMSQLTTWSQRQGVWLLAQVHTHPTDEPHSKADQEWAPTRREGFISIVIPFGAQFSTVREPHFRCFECDERGEWCDMDASRIEIFSDLWLPKAL